MHSKHGEFILWQLASGRQLVRVSRHDGACEAVAFSPRDRVFAFAGKMDEIGVVDCAGKLQATIPIDRREVQGLAFSPADGRLAAATGTRSMWASDVFSGRGWWPGDSELALFDLHGGRPETILKAAELADHNAENRFTRIAFSPDGNLLAAGTNKNLVSVIDIVHSKELHRLAAESWLVNCVCFSPDGSSLFSGDCDGQIVEWDPVAGERRSTIAAAPDWIASLAITSDGQTLVSGGAHANRPRLWNATTQAENWQAQSNLTRPAWLRLYDHGGALLSIDDNATCCAWDLATGREKWHVSLQPNTHNWGAAVLLARQQQFAYVGDSGELQLRDLESGSEVRRFQPPDEGGPYLSLAANQPEDRLVVGGTDHAIFVWDPRSWRALRQVHAPLPNSSAVDIAPSGHVFAAISDNESYLNETTRWAFSIWSTETGKEILRRWAHGNEAFTCLSFSPDGENVWPSAWQRLGAAKNIVGGSIRIWDVRSGKLRQEISVGTGIVRSVRWSPDGRRLAVRDDRNSAAGQPDRPVLDLWDLDSGRRLCRVEKQVCCEFPSADTLFTGGADTTVTAWNVEQLARGQYNPQPAGCRLRRALRPRLR